MESLQGTGLLAISIALLAGYLAHITGPLIHIPRVTLLLALGVVCGPSVLDVVPHQLTEWFPFVAHIALAMVGFLLGERFVGKELRENGPAVLWISVGESLAAAVVVFCALLAVGASLPLALLMAGIAPNSAPAAIFETVREGRAKGPLTRTLLGVVAIDDAWGVITFSVLFVAAQAVAGGSSGGSQLLSGLWEVFGAVVVGAVVAAPMIWITGRVRRGEATLVEAMGFVLLCGGLASLLEVSYLLAAMTLGALVANFAQRPRRAFHEIEGVSEPFLAIFFVFAGLKLELGTITALGLIGLTYIVARGAGLVAGGMIAGRLAGAEEDIRNRIGWCILPQAGLALGLALLVQEQLPELGDTVLPLAIATTVVFELLGPLAARWHLRRAGEWQAAEETSE